MSPRARDGTIEIRGRCLLACHFIAVVIMLCIIRNHTVPANVGFLNVISNHRELLRPSGALVKDDNSESTYQKLIKSEWIKLFPYLEHMASEVEAQHLFSFKTSTSAKHTRIEPIGDGSYVEGGQLNAVIYSRDQENRKKKFGGDFFVVILRPVDKQWDGISCGVTDQMNGSYNVSCFLPWSGHVLIHATMIHPSETIYKMMGMYSSSLEYGVLMNSTMVNSENVTESAFCSVGFPAKNLEDLCDYSNPTHGEEWTCERPPSRECPDIIWHEKVTDNKRLKIMGTEYFQKNINYRVEIEGSQGKFYVYDSPIQKWKSSAYDNDIELNPLSPSGWFSGSKWTSMKVNTKIFDIMAMKRCIQNTDIYFLGDSTLRQWFSYFCTKLKIISHGPDNSVAWSQERYGNSKALNCSLNYRSHGPPLHNPGPPSSRPYISDSIDSIRKGGAGTIIFFNLGLHFDLYDPDIFIRRIGIIRSSLIDLITRLPGVKVYVKGLHVHGFSVLCPSCWLSYRQDVLLRREFGNMEGVKYVPMWDMTSILNNNLLHPGENVLEKQINLFLSYVCD